MIIKSYEINKVNLDKVELILLYGRNEGLKSKITNDIFKNKDEIIVYDEKEILSNPNQFIEDSINKSLFVPQKKIIIKRVSDKILKIIEEIYNKDINDIKIILNAGSLEKKSKLRSFFEKSKKTLCIAFYPDSEQTLTKLAFKFFKEKNISISSSSINTVLGKCNGDRENLFNELQKIENYCKNGNKLNFEIVAKLTNIYENHSISELIDNCLAKNKNKILTILNENNFSNDDCIIITRIFLSKLKRILVLSDNYQKNKNIDLTINYAKPPIFWKDKEITKQQIVQWSHGNIKKLMYKLNELELLVKKNFNSPINLVTDFILEQSSNKISN